MRVSIDYAAASISRRRDGRKGEGARRGNSLRGRTVGKVLANKRPTSGQQKIISRPTDDQRLFGGDLIQNF